MSNPRIRRIALVPYKVGQEPEGMVKGVSADSLSRIASGICTARDFDTQDAIAAAVKACQRDPWEEWKASLRLPWRAHQYRAAWGVQDANGHDPTGYVSAAKLVAAAPDMVEALRRLIDTWDSIYVVTQADVDIALAALRKAGAPVDEPESFWDGVERISDQQRKMPSELREMAGMPKQEFHAERLPKREPESAEDVPELWVSRDMDGVGNNFADLWPGKPQLGRSGAVYMLGIRRRLAGLPDPIRDTLALKPGDCRRVTPEEYERFFKPVLDLDPSERYAELERIGAMTAEDVPELWVSRDGDGGWADAWDREPTWTGRMWEGRGGWHIPRRLADTLALKPGDCRRVTPEEYERFFKPVLDLDLDPSERYAALERLVP